MCIRDSLYSLIILQPIMVALCNRADRYIFAVVSFFFLLSFFFFSSPNLSGRRLDVYQLPYFHTWCGLSVNLECMSEMCCMLLAENTERKKSPFWHHRTSLSGRIFAAEAPIDNRKQNLLNTLTMAITLSVLDRFAKFFHCCKEQ